MSQIPEYIHNWIRIIEEMVNDNTYKLAWGRAIIECSRDKAYQNDTKLVIKYDDISECMLKYYWNQIFFFNLKQAPYKDKEPYICKYTKELIEKYKELKNTTIPCWFEEARIFFKKKKNNYYDTIIKKISKVLPKDVAHRFLNGKKSIENPTGKISLYIFREKIDYLEFNYDDLELLRDYDVILSKLLNYKWAQLLENFNYAPKIASKVRGLSNSKINRGNLSKYKDILLKEFGNLPPIDFYTEKPFANGEKITVDHVIPWSFMYSNDIWNLVLTTQSYNSSKSNKIPSQDDIDKLKKRNDRLKDLLEGTAKDDLEFAILNNLVDKYYYDCRL